MKTGIEQIKFRAQDIASNKWLYGDLRHHKDDVCIFEQGGTKGECVKAETVGRFTGLKDKNGKEIYEGDIVELRQPDGNCVPCEVSFCEKGYWAISFGINERVILGYVNRDQIEVIGNVHDNPDIKMHYSDRYGYKEK